MYASSYHAVLMAYHILRYDNKRLIAEIMLINYHVCSVLRCEALRAQWHSQNKRFINNSNAYD